MTLFDNCGFESGDTSGWNTDGILETGSGVVVFSASTGAATYGSYGAYMSCESGGYGNAECLIIGTCNLTDVDTFQFRYAVPFASVGDGEEATHHCGFAVLLVSYDESEYYSLIGEEGIYFSPEYPPTTYGWTEVNFDCSTLSGTYTVRVNAYAGDYTSG